MSSSQREMHTVVLLLLPSYPSGSGEHLASSTHSVALLMEVQSTRSWYLLPLQAWGRRREAAGSARRWGRVGRWHAGQLRVPHTHPAAANPNARSCNAQQLTRNSEMAARLMSEVQAPMPSTSCHMHLLLVSLRQAAGESCSLQ
jgi:hypothetical protein